MMGAISCRGMLPPRSITCLPLIKLTSDFGPLPTKAGRISGALWARNGALATSVAATNVIRTFANRGDGFIGFLLRIESNLIVGAGDGLSEIEIYAFVFERTQSESTFRVETKTSCVSCRQTKPLQSDHRTRGLAAGGLFVFRESDLGIERRIFRHDN